jgi:molybdopterin converting factor small subunit
VSILVKLSTTLRQCVAGYDPLAGMEMDFVPGETVAGLIARLGLDPGRIKIIMLNGRSGGLEDRLSDGDRVGLFPPVGGG